ncbi:MAG: sensor histidine kinase [Candidatus Thorarchaeota archaeon]
MSDSGYTTTEAGVLSRIDHSLFQPHPAILGARLRQQARILSILLLVGIPIFIYAQSTSVIAVFPIYYTVSITYMFAYFISRTRWYHLAAAITAGVSCIIPIGIFTLQGGWIPTDMPRVLMWETFCILVGALFLRPRYVVIQYSVISTSLLLSSIYQHNLPIIETMEFFLTDLLIASMIIISSVMLHTYANKTEEQYSTLEKRQWELEVYTQLLRHDIGNDLHALLGSVELAGMLTEVNTESTQEQISTSLKIGQSMVGLLDAFSKYPQDVEMNLVSQIEHVAAEAHAIHPELSIEIAATKRARDIESTSSRLMPMVWMNIFRNSAQHAGPSPRIQVSIFDIEDSLKITIQDNGPGISEEDKPWIFIRGNPIESGNRGIGMYLARVIIESHGGRIELVDADGCMFEISVPI